MPFAYISVCVCVCVESSTEAITGVHKNAKGKQAQIYLNFKG